MILITKCYQKINLSPRLRAEDQFLFFHLTRLKKKKKTGFVIRVTVLNQLMSLFSLSIVQYILNIRYAIDTYFQVQKEIQKKKKQQQKTNIIHIYISTGLQMSHRPRGTAALVKGMRHVLRPKTVKSDTSLWPSPSAQ